MQATHHNLGMPHISRSSEQATDFQTCQIGVVEPTQPAHAMRSEHLQQCRDGGILVGNNIMSYITHIQNSRRYALTGVKCHYVSSAAWWRLYGHLCEFQRNDVHDHTHVAGPKFGCSDGITSRGLMDVTVRIGFLTTVIQNRH